MLNRWAFKALPVLLGVLLLTGLGTADGHRRMRHPRTRLNLGFGFGAPAFPYYYPPFVIPPPVTFVPRPLYTPPPVIYVPPPVTQLQPAPHSWYYCDNPPGYYPYVRVCNSGWRRVPATPPQ